MRSSYLDLTRKLYENFKNCSMVGFYKFTSPVLLIREPQLVKTVLQTNFSSFHDNSVAVAPDADPLFATNPFFCNGDTWVSGRKRLTWAFSSMRLKILFVAVSGVCKKFEDFLDRRLKSSDKYEVELKYLFSKFTGEVVANAGFGIEGYCFDDESRPMAFDRIGDAIFKPNAINAILQSVVFFMPTLNKILKVSIFPKSLDKFFRDLVDESLEARKKDSTPRNDFLQLMANLEKTNDEKLSKDVLTAHMASTLRRWIRDIQYHPQFHWLSFGRAQRRPGKIEGGSAVHDCQSRRPIDVRRVKRNEVHGSSDERVAKVLHCFWRHEQALHGGVRAGGIGWAALPRETGHRDRYTRVGFASRPRALV